MFRAKDRTLTGNFTRGFLTALAALHPAGSNIYVGYGDTSNAFAPAVVNGDAV